MLLFKILLAPVLIALVSLAGRKWGHGVSGWLLGLPLNSGPILFFLVLQEGKGFAAVAALGSLLGILAWAAFGLIYAYLCTKLPWWTCTLAGWAVYSVIALLILELHLGLIWAFVMVIAVLTLMLLVFPRASETASEVPRRRYDLWLRMATASAMVVSLTAAAKILGPVRSGILSAFPAYTTILAVFSHQQSPAAAVKVLRGVTLGLYTAASFFLVLSLCLIHLHAAASFSWAILTALAVQGGSLMFFRYRL